MTTAYANPFVRSFNPFMVSAEEPVVAEAVNEEELSYALVQSGPAVSSEETESHLDTVEVKVRWGNQVLSLTHLANDKGFSVGEGSDFAIDNLARTSVVESRGGVSYVTVPANGTATVSKRGEHSRPASANEEIALTEGMTVTIELAPVTIEVSSVRAGKKYKVGFLAALASGAAACIGLSFVGHAAIVATMAMFMPSMNADDADNISRDQILKMQAMLNASAEKEQDRIQDMSASNADMAGGGTSGQAHEGPAGKAGGEKSVNPGHAQFKGSNDKIQLSKKEEMELARTAGFIGILNAGNNADKSLTSPWATASEQMGYDPLNTKGDIFQSQNGGDSIGNGLSDWGTENGGGGKSDQIGIDKVGTIGGGHGNNPGKMGPGSGPDGWGRGTSPTGGGHVAKAPTMRTPDITTNGRIPAEVIQRIVRQNNGRFRLCYENALRQNPGLQGRVTTKFVIGRDGLVSQAADGGSDLPSQEVIQCVVRSFNNLSFPAPSEGGIATVSYPIVFSPGE